MARAGVRSSAKMVLLCVILGLGCASLVAAQSDTTVSKVTLTNLASGDVLTWNGSNWVNGVVGTPVNAQSGTTYLVATGDRGKLVTFTNASPVAVTLPDASSTGFGNNWFAFFQNRGIGTVTISRQTSSTVDGATSITLEQGDGVLIAGDNINWFTSRGRLRLHTHQSTAQGGTLDAAAIASGVLAFTRGGIGSVPAGDDQLLVSDSASAGTWRSVPDCADSGGNHLNYTAATNAFSCGSSSSGGANHNLLSTTHPDTAAGTVARGDLVLGQGVTPSWQRLALGTANRALISDGTDAAWTALTLASAQFANQGTATTVLHGNAAGNPSFAQVNLGTTVIGTLPLSNGGTGLSSVADDTIMVGNGSAWQAKALPNGLVKYATSTDTFSAGQVPMALRPEPNTANPSTTTRYYFGPHVGWQTSESGTLAPKLRWIMPCACTVVAVYGQFVVDGSVGSGESNTVTLRANGADSSMTTTTVFNASVPSQFTMTGSVSYTAGQTFNIALDTAPSYSTSPTTVRLVQLSIVVQP